MKSFCRLPITDTVPAVSADPLTLEDAEAAVSMKFRRHTIDMIVFGILLFAAVYNILFYFFRRQDAASLYFGFCCLSVAINTLNHYIPVLSGSFAWPGNPYFINYLTVIIAIQTSLMTIRSLFPDEYSRYFARFYLALAAVCIIILMLVSFRTAELMMRIYLVFIVLFLLYGIYVFIRAIMNRREDAVLFLVGFTPIIIFSFNDVLYMSWIINTTNMHQYGLIVLCIVTTMVISRRFARALRTVEELSIESLGDEHIPS